MPKWNLQRLDHFLAVAKAPSLSEAARRFGISQPALTTSIRKLETEVGFALFDRDQGFELTALGRGFLPRAREAVARISDLQHEVELLRVGELGELRVACGPSVADGLMARSLVGFLVARPDLRVSVHVGGFPELPPLLRQRKIEFFVADYTLIGDADDFEIDPLPLQEIILFCRAGHPLAGRTRVDAREFFAYPHVAPDLPPWAEAWLKANRPDEVAAHPLSLRCSHHALLMEVVQGSDAISGAPRNVVQAGLDAGRFAVVHLAAKPMHSRAGVVHLRGRSLSPAALSLIEELTRVAGGDRSEGKA